MRSTIQAARGFLARRRTNYIRTFGTVFGQAVLADLAKFCRAHNSTFHSDSRVHAALEGRREVFLRILNHLQLSDEQLYALHNLNQTTPDQP